MNSSARSSDFGRYVFILVFLVTFFVGYLIVKLLLKIIGKNNVRMAYRLQLSYVVGVILLFLYIIYIAPNI